MDPKRLLWETPLSVDLTKFLLRSFDTESNQPGMCPDNNKKFFSTIMNLENCLQQYENK